MPFISCQSNNRNKENSEDLTAPSEVTNLSAVAGNTKIILNWSDSSENNLAKIEITYSPGGETAVEIPKDVETAIFEELINEEARGRC